VLDSIKLPRPLGLPEMNDETIQWLLPHVPAVTRASHDLPRPFVNNAFKSLTRILTLASR